MTPHSMLGMPASPNNYDFSGNLQQLLELLTSESDQIQKNVQRREVDNDPEKGQEDLLADHFRMYSFKIDPCPHSHEHECTDCPFLHPHEKARRRDPRIYSYSPIPCPDFRKGTCKREDACPFAHGVFEAWLHPSKYRTHLCKEGISCTRSICFFAHTLHELRDPTSTLTTMTSASSRSLSSASSSLDTQLIDGAVSISSVCCCSDDSSSSSSIDGDDSSSIVHGSTMDGAVHGSGDDRTMSFPLSLSTKSVTRAFHPFPQQQQQQQHTLSLALLLQHDSHLAAAATSDALRAVQQQRSAIAAAMDAVHKLVQCSAILKSDRHHSNRRSGNRPALEMAPLSFDATLVQQQQRQQQRMMMLPEQVYAHCPC